MVRSLKRISRSITRKSIILLFVNRFIKNGEKSILYKIFLRVLIFLKRKLQNSFNNILLNIIEIIAPLIQLKPKFASGVVYLIPDFPKYNKSFVLGLNFLVKAIKNRQEYSLQYRLLYEFRDILRNKGLTIRYKKEFYRLALSNRHLLFKFNKSK